MNEFRSVECLTTIGQLVNQVLQVLVQKSISIEALNMELRVALKPMRIATSKSGTLCSCSMNEDWVQAKIVLKS